MTILHFVSVSIFLIAINYELGADCYSIRSYYNQRSKILATALSKISMSGKDSSTSPESGYEDKKKVRFFGSSSKFSMTE